MGAHTYVHLKCLVMVNYAAGHGLFRLHPQKGSFAFFLSREGIDRFPRKSCRVITDLGILDSLIGVHEEIVHNFSLLFCGELC